MPTLDPPPYSEIENGTAEELVITITRSSFENVSFRPGKTTIHFSLCTYNRVVIQNDEDIEFEHILIAFAGCYIGDFQIPTLTSNNISIIFMGSIVGGNIDNKNIKSISFRNCILSNPVFLSNLERIDINYSIENIQLSRWRELLRKIKVTPRELAEIKQSFLLFNCKKVIFATNFKEEEQSINFLPNLSITFRDEISDVETIIKNAYLSSLSLNGKANGTVSIESTRIQSWYMYNFSCEKEASFYNIDVLSTEIEKSKIGIHQCNLENTWFDNVFFGRYSTIALYRSKFSKATFTSCNFPSNYAVFKTAQNVHYPDDLPDGFHKDQYEMFLQLKSALEQTGNAYEAYKFQMLSLKALYKINDLSTEDRLLLGLNDLSNKHGLSIGRPLAWFIGLSALFYVLYLLSLGRIFNCNQFDPSLIGYYFSFIDITHRNDFLVSKNEFTGWSLTLDYVSKVVISYLIYQFIAAFRKYSKK